MPPGCGRCPLPACEIVKPGECQADVGVGRFVLDRRLALAYRTLRQPRSATRTISSIAYDTGFGDLSYFNRTFRRRYGITPSGARRENPPAENRPLTSAPLHRQELIRQNDPRGSTTGQAVQE